MHGTWKKALAPALAVAVSALSLSATAVPASASGTKPTYIIAYEGPLSGGNAQLGLNMEYSVELAINQANAGTFGKLPFTLKFKPADDQGSATVSPTTAQELVSNSQVMAVVGPAFSGATEAAEPTFSAANLATVSPSATAPDPGPKGMAATSSGSSPTTTPRARPTPSSSPRSWRPSPSTPSTTPAPTPPGW